MAINISTDINVTTGGKLSSITAIQGGWQTVATESDMYAYTGSSILKGKLTNGQMFYVSSSATLYTLDITGTFPIYTYNFNEFVWPGADNAELNSFTGSIQTQVDSLTAVTGSYAVTASNFFTDDQTIDGLLILTTQSATPTYVSGGLYLDSNYDLYIGGI